MKLLKLVSATTALVLSTSVNAAIISVDWKSTGDNLITKDAVSGLEWLDITVTSNRAYNDISSKFGAGQEFEGWRYATRTEVGGFFDAFGGDSNYYSGYSTQNNGLLDNIAPVWGDLVCAVISCTPGEGYTQFITASDPQLVNVPFGIISDRFTNPSTMDYVNLSYGQIPFYSADLATGSALVRTSVVPVPAAVWLFGSGLIGFIGIAKRKARA